MNTILEIVEKHGGLKQLEEEGHFKIVRKPFMDLNIDYLGKGPNGFPMIAVAHNFIQNGDVMADPDIQVEIVNGELWPVTYQLDSMGIFQAVYQLDDKGKIVGVRSVLKQELLDFLDQWGKTLKDQGFLETA